MPRPKHLRPLTRPNRRCRCCWILLAWLLAGTAYGACENPIARVASLHGQLSINDGPASLGTALCPGDRVHTGSSARAAIQFIDSETVLRLDRRTELRLPPAPRERSYLDLLRGMLYFFSRVPRAQEVRTPYVSGAVEGTEFLVRVDPEHAAIDVLEGRVKARNPLGEVSLTAGESVLAEAGEAPRKRILLHPRDAVQWALYYPPLVLGPARAEVSPLLVEADRLLAEGRVEAATERLREAPESAEALALYGIVALTQNDKAAALAQAQRATELDPDSSAAWIALSYVYQAQFRLSEALEILRRQAGKDPSNALLRARLAELELADGRLDAALAEAERAVALAPELSRGHTVLGFAALAQLRAKQAETNFRRAIELDSQDPMSRLGLGLAKIRRGNLRQGRRQIELAAALDPDASIVRSYLGKAYYEEKRSRLARGQYGIAEQLDPKDPTPWFYGAILDLTENRPGEALLSLQRSMALNDNREVYRSKLLLDRDQAARQAALSDIYNELGFGELGRLRAAEAADRDPGNYTAHRLLADEYARLPRYEIASVSERLRAQLLQPLSSEPVLPRLEESNLMILEGFGPLDPGLNEFNNLFTRDGLRLQVSGMGGSNDTRGDEATISGMKDRFAFSLGQFYYTTDGFRDNNDAKSRLYNAFGQFSPDYRTSIQIELRRKEIRNGDLLLRFDPDLLVPDFREKENEDRVRLGLRFSPDAESDLLASFIYSDRSFDRQALRENPFPEEDIGELTDEDTDGYTGELQYLLRRLGQRFVAGAGVYRIDIDGESNVDLFFKDLSRLLPGPFPPGFPTQLPEPIQVRTSIDLDDDPKHYNAYLYSYLDLLPNLTLTLGLSADVMDDWSFLEDNSQVNPKGGLTWQLGTDTTIRAAGYRTLRRSLVSNQTLEPTQVAGFNQFFDEQPGTDATRWAVGLDQRFSPRLFSGIAFSKRDSTLPSQQISVTTGGPDGSETTSTATVDKEHRDDLEHRGYLYWLPTPRWAFSTEAYYEDFDRDGPVTVDIPRSLTTWRIPVGLRYHHPRGWFAGAQTAYIDQDLKQAQSSSSGEQRQSSSFWNTDLSMGYRLPKRWGTIRLDVSNLFDKNFDYYSVDFLSGRPRETLIRPERRVYLQAVLRFP